jgi:hypothetical protein
MIVDYLLVKRKEGFYGSLILEGWFDIQDPISKSEVNLETLFLALCLQRKDIYFCLQPLVHFHQPYPKFEPTILTRLSMSQLASSSTLSLQDIRHCLKLFGYSYRKFRRYVRSPKNQQLIWNDVFKMDSFLLFLLQMWLHSSISMTPTDVPLQLYSKIPLPQFTRYADILLAHSYPLLSSEVVKILRNISAETKMMQDGVLQWLDENKIVFLPESYHYVLQHGSFHVDEPKNSDQYDLVKEWTLKQNQPCLCRKCQDYAKKKHQPIQA